MAITKSELRAILTDHFIGAEIQINDLVGDQNHYAVQINSLEFKGKSLIEQHKMVKSALTEILQDKLHAVTIKTSDKLAK